MDVDISDEDYVIHRAKIDLEKNPLSAKAWMITAKTLYPNNFGVQVLISPKSPLNDSSTYLVSVRSVFNREKCRQHQRSSKMFQRTVRASIFALIVLNLSLLQDKQVPAARRPVERNRESHRSPTR